MKNKYKFFELLQYIKEGRMTYPLYIKDPDGYIYIWDTNSGNFIDTQEYNSSIVDNYNQIDLINLDIEVISEDEVKKVQDKEEKIDEEAKAKLIHELSLRYMDLDLTLDACQGCMDGLDEAFADLRLLDSIVTFLGGSIEDNRSQLVQECYDKAKKEQEEQERIKQEQDKVIQTLSIPIIKLMSMSDEQLGKILLEMYEKINELCKLYREIVDKNKNL